MRVDLPQPKFDSSLDLSLQQVSMHVVHFFHFIPFIPWLELEL